MIDIHPAHHAATTWRDFFIHIATIVLGLLIAIGLEQSVEHLHHLNQIHQMKLALRVESLENRHVVADDLATIAAADRFAASNIALLQQLRDPGPHAPLALTAFPEDSLFAPVDPAWLGMRDSALIALVPHQLSDNYWKLDFTAQRAVAYIQEANRIRDRIIAIENLQSPATPLSVADRDTLLLAFSEYAQQLTDLRDDLTFYDVSLQLARDDKDLSIETTNEAVKRKEGK